MSAVYELLPPGGLDQSIVLAVLLGVWVTLLFTETLGWVFIGLVVPGYLASVLVVQPTTALVIVAEALLTYLVARGLAYGLAPTRVWSPFFGRDRFFLIVIASVLVRQHDQLWLLPAISLWLEGQMGVALPPVREFYSIGLVLVPLTANLLWKPGALRGLAQLAVVTGLTYALLSGVLLAYTNLSLSSFELLYEDTALDFLGNAKSYLLLLTTAALAARFNLRFGWDFGGILVPALLGLLLFRPTELVITIAEALLLWVTTLAALRWTPLGRLNLEGPRKVALVFTLSVGLKWLLSLGVGDRLVGLRPRDLFGFGYLLSSLLALRMLQRKSAVRVLLPTLTTAGLGWVLGSVLGFLLDLVVPLRAAAPTGREVASQRLLRSPLGAAALGRVQAELAPPDPAPRSSQARRAHAEAFTALARWAEAGEVEAREDAVWAAGLADLVIVGLVDDRRGGSAVLGAERGGADGQGVTVLWPGASGLVIVVPRPVSEAPAAEVGALLAEVMKARALLVAERDASGAEDDRFARARERLAPRGDLELRGDPAAPRGTPLLHVERELPAALDLRVLASGLLAAGQREATSPRLEWSEPPALDGLPWGMGERLVLRVHPDDLRAALAASAPPRRQALALLPWLGARERGGGVRPLGPAAAPSTAELAFLERRVAAPLLARPGSESLAIAGRMAGLVDHVLWDISHCDAGPCRALAEDWRPAAAGWGTLVVGGGDSGLVIEAPHAFDEPGTGRLAAELWAASSGRALIIGGAAPLGAHAPVQALHQAAMSAGAGAAVLQIRGLGARAGVGDEVVIGLGQPALDPRPLPPGLTDMFLPGGPLAWVPARRLADGSPALAPLSGVGNAQLEFGRALIGAPAAVLWFPAALRRAHVPHDACAELARVALLAESQGCAPVDEIAEVATVSRGGGETEGPLRFAAALEQVERYAEGGDLHLLRGVLAAGWTLRAGLGRATGRGFVVLARRRGPRALVWLGPSLGGRALLSGPPSAWRRSLWLRGRSLILGEATR